MLPYGSYEAEIIENSVRDFGTKSAVVLYVRNDDGADGEVLIFLSEKAMGMARASLKRCGFDIDTRDLEELANDRKVLAGLRIPEGSLLAALGGEDLRLLLAFGAQDLGLAKAFGFQNGRPLLALCLHLAGHGAGEVGGRDDVLDLDAGDLGAPG